MEYENGARSGFRVHNSNGVFIHYTKVKDEERGMFDKLKSDLIQTVMYVWSNYFANFVTKFRPSNQLRLMNDAVNQKS